MTGKRVMPVVLYQIKTNSGILYTESPAPAGAVNIDTHAIVGFGIRPTGAAIRSTRDFDEFRGRVEKLCDRVEWFHPVFTREDA